MGFLLGAAALVMALDLVQKQLAIRGAERVCICTIDP